MRKPRLTAKVVRGLDWVEMAAGSILQDDPETLSLTRERYEDAKRAVEYITRLRQWYESQDVQEGE